MAWEGNPERINPRIRREFFFMGSKVLGKLDDEESFGRDRNFFHSAGQGDLQGSFGQLPGDIH